MIYLELFESPPRTHDFLMTFVHLLLVLMNFVNLLLTRSAP